MDRYSAKLFFQFRVDCDGSSGQRRLCEERIIVLEASSATAALKKAKRRGTKAETHCTNHDGDTVHFEFIGVMDLLHLGCECESDEVWYDIRERILPMERRDKFIPAESDLSALRQKQ